MTSSLEDILVGMPVPPLLGHGGIPDFPSSHPLSRSDLLEGHIHSFSPVSSQGIFLGRWGNITLTNGGNVPKLPSATNIALLGPGLTSIPTILGLIGGMPGRVVHLHNFTDWPVELVHLSLIAPDKSRIFIPDAVSLYVRRATLVYLSSTNSYWYVLNYLPWFKPTQSYVWAGNSVTIPSAPNEVFANLLWGPSIQVPSGQEVIVYASGSARLTAGAPAGLHIAFHAGGSASRSLTVYTDSISVISVSYVRSFLGSGSVTPELVGVTAPNGPNATFERREMSVLAVYRS